MRREGWELMLAEHLDRVPEFAIGRDDCALWCARWIEKATGLDLVTPWEGKYHDERSLAALMESRGFRSVADIASASLPPRPIALAMRGDLTLYPTGCLGICNGQVSHFLSDAGYLTYPTLQCLRAWGVDG